MGDGDQSDRVGAGGVLRCGKYDGLKGDGTAAAEG